jgi:hypothetical protein
MAITVTSLTACIVAGCISSKITLKSPTYSPVVIVEIVTDEVCYEVIGENEINVKYLYTTDMLT